MQLVRLEIVFTIPVRNNQLFLGSFIFVLGLSLGSFMNVIIHRLPRQLDFVKSRSRCLKCSQELGWLELVPLLSFIFLKGRCLHCKSLIGWRYPVIELLSGIISLLIFLAFRNNINLLVFWLIVANFLLLLALFDLEYLILPDSILVTLAIFILTAILLDRVNVISLNLSLTKSIIGSFSIFASLGSIWFFSKGRGMGFGDVKFGFILGLLFGIKNGLLIIYMAALLGTVWGLGLLTIRKAGLKSKLPFGLFMSLSAIFFILFQDLINNFIKTIFT